MADRDAPDEAQTDTATGEHASGPALSDEERAARKARRQARTPEEKAERRARRAARAAAARKQQERLASREARRRREQEQPPEGPEPLPDDWPPGKIPPDATVVVEGLHVEYNVGGARRPSIRELLTRSTPETPRSRSVHAVRGIDLIARRGETIGFIGDNGSGKSTTLRAIAGLLPPTRGTVLATAQPVLLGIGAALDGRLTGRRNVELGCLALGLPRADIDAKMGEIVDFAELGDFLDLPMQTYSSGMRARLHFAISTAVEPEVLLIDEALSVGDERFKHKSRERITALRESAGTVFIVSHSLSMLSSNCTRVVWIHKGEIHMDGRPNEVINAYRDR